MLISEEEGALVVIFLGYWTSQEPLTSYMFSSVLQL
jgi:hypothetical protein